MVVRVNNPLQVISAIEGVLLHKECVNGWAFHSPARAGKLSQQWARLVESGLGVCYVLSHREESVGFILGMVCEDLLTGTKEALEYLWMVLPSHRSGGGAVELLSAFEDHAVAQGCKRILAGNSVFVKPKVMARFYRKRGYQPHAEVFRKEID